MVSFLHSTETGFVVGAAVVQSTFHVVVLQLGEEIRDALVLFDERLKLRNVLLIEFNLAFHILEIGTVAIEFQLAPLLSAVSLCRLLLQPLFHLGRFALIDFLNLAVLIPNDRYVFLLQNALLTEAFLILKGLVDVCIFGLVAYRFGLLGRLPDHLTHLLVLLPDCFELFLLAALI